MQTSHRHDAYVSRSKQGNDTLYRGKCRTPGCEWKGTHPVRSRASAQRRVDVHINYPDNWRTEAEQFATYAFQGSR